MGALKNRASNQSSHAWCGGQQRVMLRVAGNRALQGLKVRVARPVIVLKFCRPWPVTALFKPG
jgi:hypothetical protein